MGLAISQKLVGIMGGRIWVESELGKGSTFHFSVPVDIATLLPLSRTAKMHLLLTCASLCARLKGAPSGTHHRGIHDELRILIAEDNDVNKRVIKKMLRKLGFRADIAR